jgi:hypothetical protein
LRLANDKTRRLTGIAGHSGELAMNIGIRIGRHRRGLRCLLGPGRVGAIMTATRDLHLAINRGETIEVCVERANQRIPFSH